MDTSFGAVLRRHRRAAGLTQEALAERAGLSGQAVGALERGDRRFPYRDTVDRLADALRLDEGHRAELVAAAARHRGPRPESTEPPPRQSAPTGPPRQFPPPVAHFTGRDAEVDAIVGLLDRSSTVVVSAIAGMGGVGKTTLAVHVGHRVAERFPDGLLHVDLRGGGAPLPVHEALGQLLRAIGVADDEVPTDLAEASARFRSGLAGRRVLLLLDDAANAEQVRPLLPATPGCAAIVTGRHALDALPQAHHIRLDVLTEQEALRLLAASVGRERVDAEPGAAAEVVRRCGRLPLAVHLVGARLAARPDWPIAHLARKLADHHRLDELERGDSGVRASLAVSVDQLDPPDATAFALLGLPDAPDVSLPVAARLLDLAERDAERLLERLADAHLLDAAAPGRYRMHDLLRTYARERAAETVAEADRVRALTRAADLFVAAAWRSLALGARGSIRQTWADPAWQAGSPDFADTAEAFAWLDDHRHHLVGVTRTPGVPPERLLRLAPGLFTFYLSRGYWLDWSLLSRAALDAVGSDRVARAIVRQDLGLALVDLAHAWSGDPREGFEQLDGSLADFRALGHDRGAAGCLVNTAQALELFGRVAEAIAKAEESLAIHRELRDNPAGEASTHEYLGSLYDRTGRPADGLHHYRISLRLYEETGHGHGSAGVMRRIGVNHHRAGRHDEARDALHRAASLSRRVGDRVGEVACLEALGSLHLDAHDYAEAVRVLRAAADLAERFGDRRRQDSIQGYLDAALSGAEQAR
ncbi:transcriptional regulator with XRE-family HTH domain/tetratricopeptide (TPR) repeat protein [Saccharothrix tamanrassetensis]|uniref:Transcriptional regulator with XRE-family HTH domain/tetratricopeptide (TPR) repeat protein n=1 Tax=Saccharothrix tamanrassetensis TaxID=1051531 RepID=A0A841CI91_9PSEU|nr:XRE family transcriptional regulator [Saccharothrix tamanrassetensis]MBB5957131.1 transcriptional regulator with XRE-family HTH domain/tetratricopeptide (TPR) repeat protein [Saccharothrix tamanrassetensis]